MFYGIHKQLYHRTCIFILCEIKTHYYYYLGSVIREAIPGHSDHGASKESR